MEEFDVIIGGRKYSMTAVPEAVETVREYARRLDYHACEVLAEFAASDEEPDEVLLMLLASLHAQDELETALSEREALLVSGTIAVREATAQVRELTELLGRKPKKKKSKAG